MTTAYKILSMPEDTDPFMSLVANSSGEYEIEFHVPPSLAGLFVSDKFISLVVDTSGRNLSTFGMMKILYHAIRMAPCHRDGKRRSRAVWICKTRARLQESLKEFLQLFPFPVPRPNPRAKCSRCVKFNDIEFDVWFRSFNKPTDKTGLPSAHASFYVFDEFLETDSDIFSAATSRVTLYPDKRDNGVGCATDKNDRNAFVLGTSNHLPYAGSHFERLMMVPPSNTHALVLPWRERWWR